MTVNRLQRVCACPFCCRVWPAPHKSTCRLYRVGPDNEFGEPSSAPAVAGNAEVGAVPQDGLEGRSNRHGGSPKQSLKEGGLYGRRIAGTLGALGGVRRSHGGLSRIGREAARIRRIGRRVLASYTKRARRQPLAEAERGLIAELREEAASWDGTAGQSIGDLCRRAADEIEALRRDNAHAYTAYQELTQGRP